MKKILFVLLCTASVILAGCKQDNGNDPSSPTPDPTPTPTPVDTTTYLTAVRVYTSTDFLNYASISVSYKDHDSTVFHPLTNMEEVALDSVLDSKLIQNAGTKLQWSKSKVYTTTIRLRASRYDLKVNYTRNSTALTSDPIYECSSLSVYAAGGSGSAYTATTSTTIGDMESKDFEARLTAINNYTYIFDVSNLK